MSVGRCSGTTTMYIQLFCLFLSFQYIATKVVDLSCNDIRAFVDGHNSRRLLVAKGEVSGQPAASKMTYLIWDDELAKKAKKWASTNKFSHNPDKTVDSSRFTTGENIYKIKSTDRNLRLEVDKALDAWFKEYKDYEYGPITMSDFSSSGPAVGHYTQMVWSNSIYIGCGVSQKFKRGVEYYVVCNYGPSGNYLGQKPYEAGAASNKLVCSGDCSHLYGDEC